MNFARLTFFACVFSLLLVPAHAKHRAAAAAEPHSPASYKGAIVIDAQSGKSLFEENPDVISPPASMTKLMTFAVLADKLHAGNLTLDTMVRIDVSDAKMGGTQVYLDPRETFSVEELIYAMMIQSANDAAHALARQSAGSVEAFVELMNAKARELGMNHTTFRTPHGLTSKRQSIEEGDLTTPRDFALLCRHLVLKTDVLKYTSVRERNFGTSRAKGPIKMDNHNKLLGRVAGVDGLKTGYTENAGYCLSATAERNGRRVIVVIMGAFGPKGHEIDLGHARDVKTIELLERGFAALPPLPAGAVANAVAGAPGNAGSASASSPGATTSSVSPGAVPVNSAKPAVSGSVSANSTTTAASVNPASAGGTVTNESPVTAPSPTAAPTDEQPSVKFSLPPTASAKGKGK